MSNVTHAVPRIKQKGGQGTRGSDKYIGLGLSVEKFVQTTKNRTV